MRDNELSPEKREVFEAMDALIASGRGEILIIITPGVVDIMAGKRKRFEKGLDRKNTRG